MRDESRLKYPPNVPGTMPSKRAAPAEPRRGYRDVKVPEDLMEAVDRVLEHGGLGYRNPGEFAVDAIRRRVEDLSARLGLKPPPPDRRAGEE